MFGEHLQRLNWKLKSNENCGLITWQVARTPLILRTFNKHLKQNDLPHPANSYDRSKGIRCRYAFPIPYHGMDIFQLAIRRLVWAMCVNDGVEALQLLADMFEDDPLIASEIRCLCLPWKRIVIHRLISYSRPQRLCKIYHSPMSPTIQILTVSAHHIRRKLMNPRCVVL